MQGRLPHSPARASFAVYNWSSLVPSSGRWAGGNFLVLCDDGVLDHFSRLSINRKSDLPVFAICLFNLGHSNEVTSRPAEDLEISNHKRMIDRNVGVGQQVAFVGDKNPYACDLHRD